MIRKLTRRLVALIAIVIALEWVALSMLDSYPISGWFAVAIIAIVIGPLILSTIDSLKQAERDEGRRC